MKYIVFGASGETGQLIVSQLIEKNQNVVAVLRSKEQARSFPKEATIAIGTSLDQNFVFYTIQEDDTIISAIGPTRKTRNPWSPLVSPKYLMENSIQNIANACIKNHAKALIYISAYGVGSDWWKLPLWMRAIIQLSNLKFAYADHARAESLLKVYDFPKLILKPVLLVNGSDYKKPMDVTGKKISPLAKINRSAVARYISEIDTKLFSTQTVELLGEK